jgi:hypothetical protein
MTADRTTSWGSIPQYRARSSSEDEASPQQRTTRRTAGEKRAEVLELLVHERAVW